MRSVLRRLLTFFVLAVYLPLLVGCQTSGPEVGPTPTPTDAGAQASQTGQPSPTFNLTGPDGSTVSFKPAESDDELHLLLFWSHRWDPNAEVLLQRAIELHERYAPRGLSILAVTYDEEPNGVRNFLSQQPLPFPVAIGAASTAERFELKAVPTSVLVDSSGTVVARWEGHYSLDELAEKISNYLPGRSGNSEQ